MSERERKSLSEPLDSFWRSLRIGPRLCLLGSCGLVATEEFRRPLMLLGSKDLWQALNFFRVFTSRFFTIRRSLETCCWLLRLTSPHQQAILGNLSPRAAY